MLSAILIMALGAVVLGAALGYASIKFKVEGNPLVEKIEAILPDRKSTRLNSSHLKLSRMPSSA